MATYDPALFVNGRYQADLAGGAAPYPGNPEAFAYDPEAVGGGVAQYYGLVSSALPTFEPIQRNIAGIPNPEVARRLEQAAAERGVGIGSYGGGNTTTNYLRALGLTGQELQDTGIEQYRQAMATIPALNPSDLFISPTNLSQMNLNWMTTQSELNAAMARQRAADQAALERARLSASTQIDLGRMNQATAASRLQAEQAAAQVRRQDALDYNAQTRSDITDIYQTLYGDNPYYGGVQGYGGPSTPAAPATTPATTPAVVQSGGNLWQDIGREPTGQIYFGPQQATREAEYNVVAGLEDPNTYAVEPRAVTWDWTGYE
jgi:hypothetical protein